MDQHTPIARFTVPWGGQAIELQEVRLVADGAALLRVRIREGRRFTIFDIDVATSQSWGEARRGWAAQQLAAAQTGAGGR